MKRIVLAVVCITLAIAYIVALLWGFIPEGRKLGAVELAILLLALVIATALVRPDAFERLKLLELSGFRLEMLERVRERQERQENQLNDISLILPLLFPEAQRRHLLNLAHGATQHYEGNAALRSELRGLRSSSLIEMLDNHTVAEIGDGQAIDLASYVRLTPFGTRWIRRIEGMEQAAAASDA